MLVKPILLNQAAFDKNDGTIFQFLVVGGTQVVKNRLTIRDNITNEIIYQEIIQSFRLEHSLIAGTNLINGNVYNAYVNTYDINDNISEDSNIIQFYCYTKPVLRWDNKPSNNVIDSNSFTLEIGYTQAENELLNGVQVFLYDETNQLILESDRLFNTNTPPLSIEYRLNGLDDNKIYRVEFVGVTINQTVIRSEMYTFDVKYLNPQSFGIIELENKCNDGYIKIGTSLQIIQDESNPSPPIYIDGEKVDLRKDGDYVKWTNGYSIDGDFVCGVWFNLISMGEFTRLVDDDGNGFILSLQQYDVGGNLQMRAEVEARYGDDIKIYDYSDFVNPINTNSQVVVWLRYVNGKTTVYIETIDRVDDYIYWNGDSNVEYHYSTTIPWNGSNTKYPSPPLKYNNTMESILIENTILTNGIFDHFYLTENPNQEFTSVKPSKDDWDGYTVIICDFDDNIRGGNVDFVLSEVSQIHIKRRLKGNFEWTTIKVYNIKELADFDIDTIDSFVPNFETFEYALVPILSSGAEGTYSIAEVTSKFFCLYISDLDNIFKIYTEVIHSHTQNQLEGVHQTIGSRVPFIIKNSNVNYEQGNVSGRLLGYNYENTRILDAKDIIKQRNDILEFLTNGKAKVIKDVDGSICLAEIISPIPNTFQINGAGFSINFNYIERGHYDNQLDLYDFGLIEGVDYEYNTISI